MAATSESSPRSPGFLPRREFEAVAPRYTAFALLSLEGSDSLKALGFLTPAYDALEAVIDREWPGGIEEVERDEGESWSAKLSGAPWRKAGHEELESIRLLLAIFEALAQEGWMMVDGVSAGSSKKAAHSMVFAWGEAVEANPPRFFALSFPLPDRISIVDCPAIATPAIISAVRSAIETSSTAPLPQPHRALLSSAAPWLAPLSPGPISPQARSSSSHSHRKSVTIKEEGWANEGVYSYKIGGYTSWYKPGINNARYDNNHPALLLSLLNKLDANHFALTTSIPLLPLKKRRDILLFHSLPTATYLTGEDRGVRQTWLGERRRTTNHGLLPSPPPLPPRRPAEPLSLSPQTEMEESLMASDDVAGSTLLGSRMPTNDLSGASPRADATRFHLPEMPSTANADTAASTLARELSLSAAPTDKMQLVVGPPDSRYYVPTCSKPDPTVQGCGIPADESAKEGSQVPGRRPLQRRASSWVLEDAPDVLPDPQPVRDEHGRWMVSAAPKPTEPSGLILEAGPPNGRKKGLGRLFHRHSRSEDLHTTPGSARGHDAMDPPTPIHAAYTASGQTRPDTAYTAAGLAGVGTYLKTPLARADPTIHQAMPGVSTESPTVTPQTPVGSDGTTKFVENFRDTMEVQLEDVGTPGCAQADLHAHSAFSEAVVTAD